MEKASERNMVNITLTVSKEERKALKQIALDNDITVSALLRLWLKEYKEKECRSALELFSLCDRLGAGDIPENEKRNERFAVGIVL